MQILDFDNQWTLLTPVETQLLEGIKGLCPDRFWRECGNGFRPLFHPEQLEQVWSRCLWVHADFLQSDMYLFSDMLRTLVLRKNTVVAEKVHNGMIGNGAAIGQTASFEIGHPLVL